MEDELFKKLKKDIDAGFTIRWGDMMQALLSYSIANSMLIAEMLRRQLALEQQLTKEGIVDHELVNRQLDDLANDIREQANKRMDEYLADFVAKNKDPEAPA